MRYYNEIIEEIEELFKHKQEKCSPIFLSPKHIGILYTTDFRVYQLCIHLTSIRSAYFVNERCDEYEDLVEKLIRKLNEYDEIEKIEDFSNLNHSQSIRITLF